MIDMLVMATMFARPHQDRIFKGGRSKDKCEKPDGPARFKREVGEQPMVPDRDAEATGQKHREEKCDLKPIETEMVEVERNSAER